MSLGHRYAHSSPSGGDGHILPGRCVHLHYVAHEDDREVEDASPEGSRMDVLDSSPLSVSGPRGRRGYDRGEGVDPGQSTGGGAGGGARTWSMARAAAGARRGERRACQPDLPDLENWLSRGPG